MSVSFETLKLSLGGFTLKDFLKISSFGVLLFDLSVFAQACESSYAHFTSEL